MLKYPFSFHIRFKRKSLFLFVSIYLLFVATLSYPQTGEIGSTIQFDAFWADYRTDKIYKILPIKDRVWIAGDNGALKYNPEEKRVEAHYTNLPGKQVRCVCEDQYDRAWFCCWDKKKKVGKGISAYDSQNDTWIKFSNKSGDRDYTIPDDDIVSIECWRTYNRIIAVTRLGKWFDINLDNFTIGSLRDEKLINPKMCVDVNGRMWVASFYGLYYFDTDPVGLIRLYKKYQYEDSDQKYCINYHFNDIDIYDNVLLISTEGGYVIYDIAKSRLSKPIIHPNSEMQIPQSIVKDSRGYVWVVWPTDEFGSPISVYDGEKWVNVISWKDGSKDSKPIKIDKPLRCIEKDDYNRLYFGMVNGVGVLGVMMFGR